VARTNGVPSATDGYVPRRVFDAHGALGLAGSDLPHAFETFAMLAACSAKGVR